MHDGDALRRHVGRRPVDVEREVLAAPLAEHDVLLDAQIPGVWRLPWACSESAVRAGAAASAPDALTNPRLVSHAIINPSSSVWRAVSRP